MKPLGCPTARSDSFFQYPHLRVDQLLSVYRAGSNATAGIPAAGSGSASSADVSFPVDRPYSSGPNAGVQFWWNSNASSRLLRLWWNLPGGQFHMRHDFEQHILQWTLLHLRGINASIETLELQSMATGVDARNWPIAFSWSSEEASA